MRFTKVHLAALAFVAGVLPAAVSADGWFSRAGEVKEVTLTDLLKNPREYIDVEVEFTVYFDAPGEQYNPYFTQFSEEQYGNFSAWPIDARLYEKRDFPRPYPFFFASRFTKAWKNVKDVDHLRVVELRAVVRQVFKNQPWIEVLDWSSSSGGLSAEDIRDVIHGDANFVAGRYKDAARLYERADSSSLVDSVRADLQRRLGDAYFHLGEYGDALDAYRTGLRHAPENAILKQGADAADAARARARSARRGEAVEGSAPTVASQDQPVVASNGVDEVIRLLEDPAKVEAEVVAWREALAARAAELRGEPSAIPVSDTQPASQESVVEEPVTEAPAEEVSEPEVTVEPTETEAVEEPAAEEPAEEPAAEPAEAPAEPVAEPAEVAEPVAAPVPVAPEVTEEPVSDATGESACGSEAPEGCATEQGCGAEGSTDTAGVPAEEPVAWQGDERVVWVSGQMVRLPRLPFHGAEDVTDDDLRAIIEDVLLNPETDE